MIHAQNNIKTILLAPASQTNGATRTANLDVRGADYAEIVIPLSSAINTNAVGPTIVLKESDDTVATNFATWSTSCTLTATSIAAACAKIFKVDTRSRKAYLQLSISSATATNDVIVSGAISELSRLQTLPGSAAAQAGTNDTVVIL